MNSEEIPKSALLPTPVTSEKRGTTPSRSVVTPNGGQTDSSACRDAVPHSTSSHFLETSAVSERAGEILREVRGLLAEADRLLSDTCSAEPLGVAIASGGSLSSLTEDERARCRANVSAASQKVGRDERQMEGFGRGRLSGIPRPVVVLKRQHHLMILAKILASIAQGLDIHEDDSTTRIDLDVKSWLLAEITRIDGDTPQLTTASQTLGAAIDHPEPAIQESSPFAETSGTIQCSVFGVATRPFGWCWMRPIGQVGLGLSLAVAVIGAISQSSFRPGPNFSSYGADETSHMRPVAYAAQEIFLPRSLREMTKDATLRNVLRDRDVARLDAYLDAKGLRNVWFLVRYRGTESDGSTWRAMTGNFECKLYHVHSSTMGEIENKLSNLEVLARVMAKAAGRQSDSIVSEGQANDSTVSITHFNDATIISIPDEATGLRHIGKDQIDAWRRLAGTVTR